MKGNEAMKTITTNISYPAFALFAFACFALSPQARAACQEGCNLNGGGTTVLGDEALVNNFGVNNTAVGSAALNNNTSGSDNTAIGEFALVINDTGDNNTAIGAQALENNMTGHENTATGVDALPANTTGFFHTANGFAALLNNTTGNQNTAIGYYALSGNLTGSNNIALGFQAGLNISGSTNIDIGNVGVAGESKTIRLGTRGSQRNTFIAGISGVTVANGVGVIIDNNGHLGTVVSSERFKDKIKPMDKASEAILGLKPVTFHYKQELDPEGIPQFGLVAEEVEKVNPDLVARDDQGKPYTVRYEAVNAMLLNEFLKEHREVQKQKATITRLKQDFQSKLAEQQKQIAALTATVQRVSAQVEVSRPAPPTVEDNH
jgi:hypothetical protein